MIRLLQMKTADTAHTVEFLIIHTPYYFPFSEKKDANFRTLINFIYRCENEITIILCFVQQKRKHCEVSDVQKCK